MIEQIGCDVRETSADRHHLQVDESGCRRDRVSDGAARAFDRRDRDRVTIAIARGEFFAGEASPALNPGPGDGVGTGCDGFHASDAPTLARVAETGHFHVPDVAGIAGGAGHGRPVQNQPSADTGRHDHAHDVLVAASCPHPVLGEGDAETIHAHRDRYAGDALLDQGLERKPAPVGEIERGDQPVALVERACCADSDSREDDVSRHCGQSARYRQADGC